MEVTMWPLVCSPPPRQVSSCFHFGKRLPAFLPIRPIIISPAPYPLCTVLQRLQLSCHGQGVRHFPAFDLIGCRIDIWDHLGCCPTVAAAHNISSTIATRIMEPIISVLYIMRLAWLLPEQLLFPCIVPRIHGLGAMTRRHEATLCEAMSGQ